MINITKAFEMFETSDPAMAFYFEACLKNIDNFEGFVEPRLFVKAVPAKEAEENDYARVYYGDICVIASALLDKNKNRLTSVNITRSLCEKYGISNDTLISKAIYNTLDIAKPEVLSLGRMRDYDFADAYVVCDTVDISGSAVLFLPNVIDDIYKKVKGDFYVVPTSKDEVVVVPVSKNVDPMKLRRVLLETNNLLIAQKIFLSNTLYVYRHETKRLEPFFRSALFGGMPEPEEEVVRLKSLVCHDTLQSMFESERISCIGDQINVEANLEDYSLCKDELRLREVPAELAAENNYVCKMLDDSYYAVCVILIVKGMHSAGIMVTPAVLSKWKGVDEETLFRDALKCERAHSKK